MRRLIYIALIAIVACISVGCKSIRYVDRIHTEYKDRLRIDSVYSHDTIMQRDSIVTLLQGDTLRVDRWHWRDRVAVKWRTSLQHDTVAIVDTLRSVQVKEVAKPLNWWQRTMQGGGYALMVIIAIFLIYQGLKISGKIGKFLK
jgi:hypothetical protein